MTPPTLGGSAMEGNRTEGSRRPNPAGISQLCKLQSGWQARRDQAPLRAWRRHLSQWGPWCSMGTPALLSLSCLAPAIGAPFAWTCQLAAQAFAFARLSLALLPSDPCTVPSTFPSNTTGSESTSQASCTKDSRHHFLPSHLLHSSPWFDIKLFAVSHIRCDRRDPISFTALSPVTSQCLAHGKGSINTGWASRYFNNYKYYIVSTWWQAPTRWYDSQEQEMYLFFHLFFPPKFLCTPCVLVCYNKIPRTRWLKQHNFNFSSARSTSCQAWFLVRALSDLHVAAFSLWPHVVFPLCASMGEISVFHRVSHSYEDTNPSGSGPHPYDFIYDFTLNYLPKGPSSKLSHMEG